MSAQVKDRVIGVILAGGLARRMGGGDKALIEVGGRSLLAHVVDRLEPQVDAMVLNANGDPGRFEPYSLPVVSDPIEGAAGPLAGVLAGLLWTRANAKQAQWIVTVAADTPFFPENLVEHLMQTRRAKQADMACAASNARAHPVFGLWPVKLADRLRHALFDDGIRKVDIWTGQYHCAVAEFSSHGFDPFFNVNRPEDVRRAEKFLSRAVA